MSNLISSKDLEFLLYDVFQAQQLTELPFYQDHDRTTFDGVINTAKKIATEYFLPHNAKADANEPQFDGVSVTTISEVKEAWKHYSESGLLAARHAYDDGGMQLPAIINTACVSYFMSVSYTHLTLPTTPYV